MFRFIIVSILTTTVILSLTIEKRISYKSYNQLDYEVFKIIYFYTSCMNDNSFGWV